MSVFSFQFHIDTDFYESITVGCIRNEKGNSWAKSDICWILEVAVAEQTESHSETLNARV